ncbi:hypothetical protein [Oceanobacillus sp. J11TS1]|uniref:hypothetical protein n=1 Tax=Oceanobacillus sp. J11TS1 TaxID=2807191 RepID=UPI001B2E0323|nr:hypothetical protein [Oceanobacillus sp. J11TS1]GIO25383.1 hypothetical protein J11TS1_39640 [Oceanobacillus sp. J11TS1]
MLTKEVEMSLLDKRKKNLHESQKRTEELLLKVNKLGLIDVYRDAQGRMITQKNINHHNMNS